MKSFLIAYAATVVVFLVIDGVWLGVVAKNFYFNQLGGLMRENVFVLPAALFYLFYAAGLVFLAVRPGADPALLSVAGYGALVGFLAYGTYDMTNLSTLKDWPAMLSMVDLVWGSLLSGTSAVLGALAVRLWA